MFGYILPSKEKLQDSDFNLLKSYYCGLCKLIKRKFSNLLRLGLNYDCTFFAVFFDSISKEELNYYSCNCIKHPFSSINCICTNTALNYAADINVALIYYKLVDDYNDDNHYYDKLLSNIIKMYKSKLTYDFIDNILERNLTKLSLLEKSNSILSLDEICDPFSNAMGELFYNFPCKLIDNSKTFKNTLFNLGYCLGKWIYLMDAIDDLKNDIINNKFNPLIKVYNKENLSYDLLLDKIKKNIEFQLTILINNCESIIDNIKFSKNTALLNNVFSNGLIEKQIHIFDNL